MATSLSKQLQKLKTPQTNVLIDKTKKPSILFTASEAAKYSRETFYEIGITGFTELSTVNDSFDKFKETLFGKGTKDFQRLIQTKEQNRKLDKIIEEFLLLLSPYLQKHAALKALEWLIQRFLINQMNKESLMMCIFPYYETILFSRILQTIDIRDPQNPWFWLKNYSEQGRPIPKETVFLRWTADQWLRNFISKCFMKSVKVHKNHENLQQATSLLISTHIGGLSSAPQINENHISSICQTLQTCFSSENNDALSGVLLVIGQLCISVQLSHDLLHEIIERIIKISNSEMLPYSALTLLTIFYHQRVKQLTPSEVKTLENKEPFLAQITKLSKTKPVAVFMVPFVKGFFRLMATETLKNNEMMTKLGHLATFIEEVYLSPSESSKIIRHFIRGVAEHEDELKSVEDLDYVMNLVKTIEIAHPDGFDKAATNILSAVPKDKENKVTFQKQIITKFKEKWVVSLTTTVTKQEKKTRVEVAEDDLWRECLNPGKLSSSSIRFLKTTLKDIILPNDKISSPFWDIAGVGSVPASLRKLIKVVTVLVRHQIEKTSTKVVDVLLTELFVNKLRSVKRQIYFLAMIIGYDLGAEDVGIDKSLKFWALSVTSALLTSPKAERKSHASLAWVLDVKEPLVVSLIVPMIEGEPLCSAAFKVLEAVQKIEGGLLLENNLCVLVDELILKKDFFIGSQSYLPKFMSVFVVSKKGRISDITRKLFTFITDPHVTLHIKCSVLYALSDIQSPDVLSKLLPLGSVLLKKAEKMSKDETMDIVSSSCLYNILRQFSASPALFSNVEGGREFFMKTLEMTNQTINLSEERFSPQEVVANCKLLQQLPQTSGQLEVLDILISRIVETDNPREASKLKKELNNVTLKAKQIISLWTKYDLVKKANSVKEERAKRLKIQKSTKSHTCLKIWRKFELSLELIGVMTELKCPWQLIGSICDHLQELITQPLSISDRLEQQMLSVCHHLLKLSSKQLSKEEFITNCKLNVALIVRCIRKTANPDVHRRGLLILSLAAAYFPDEVLHNIMAIFTFMGTSLLRRDDAFSFHVIHETITSIVPALIQAESSEPRVLLKKLSQVAQVFVDALPNLAEHRRLPLFTQLATTLGVSQYLWLVMVLIADAYVARGSTTGDESSQEDEPRRLPRNIRFALVLYGQFSIVDQLKASCEVVDFICSLPEDKEELKASGSTLKKIQQSNTSTLIINIATRSSRQLRQLKYTCTGLLVHLLQSEKFVEQVYESTMEQQEAEIDELKELYKTLLEKSLSYLKVVSHQEKVHKGNPSGRFWSALQRKLIDLVDAVNSLLPPQLLIEVIANLLLSNVDLIRCRAMEILASKLQPDVKFFSDEEVVGLIQFIDTLREMSSNVNEPESNRQTAFFVLQLLVRKLVAHTSPDTLLPILATATTIVKKGDPSSKVLAQAALVVAESVNALKTHSLVYLETLVPALLSILQKTSQNEEFNSDNLVIAAAAAIQRIVEHIPRLLPKNDLKSLLMLSCQLITRREEEGFRETRLTTKLTHTLAQLARHVELRILIPVMTETYGEMAIKHLSSVPPLLTVLESLISSVKSTDLVLFKQPLTNFFMAALDVRNSKAGEDENSIVQVEGSVISALSRFLLKMNEDDNTRIFSTLLSWARDHADEYPDRLITFFRFSDHHAGRLKVLFIKAKLAKHSLDFGAQVLDANNNLLQEESNFGEGEEAERKATDLVKYVLETLSKIFLYDSVQFINEENFNIVLKPLTNQIENSLGGEEEQRSRLTLLKTCVVRFTKAVGDDSLWKELNREVLLRIRTDNDPKVILSALEIFEGLVEALGEDYLRPLLPDTIPAVTEALESLDDDVEKKTKEIFNKMESILGDSLRAYLDT